VEPGLLGVSSGSALGAVAAVVLGRNWIGPGMPSWLESLTAACAFAAGLGSLVLVLALARVAGRSQASMLLLSGIALNAFAHAATGLLIYLADDSQLRSLTFWNLGSLGAATWPTLALVLPPLALSSGLALPLGRSLNALALGESEARALGINVKRLRRSAVLAVALLVGTSVAITGVIGFVGLVVPHLARLALGADYRRVLPASALLGATLLVAADTLARTCVAPKELPLGVVTAGLGGPFFLALLLRERRRFS
jgi:iron complex transport system permease protein